MEIIVGEALWDKILDLFWKLFIFTMKSKTTHVLYEKSKH